LAGEACSSKGNFSNLQTQRGFQCIEWELSNQIPKIFKMMRMRCSLVLP
jgi:hypothetical protein